MFCFFWLCTAGVLPQVLRYVPHEARAALPVEKFETRSWIICDGDIDPEWIESLNSVLDDNRLLTMPNGERIQFGPNVNFIFETHAGCGPFCLWEVRDGIWVILELCYCEIFSACKSCHPFSPQYCFPPHSSKHFLAYKQAIFPDRQV